MFSQLLTPVADSLGLSFLVAVLPIVTVLVLLGLLRLPAWIAALAGLIVALIISITVWQMPPNLALNSVANGAVFALWPVRFCSTMSRCVRAASTRSETGSQAICRMTAVSCLLLSDFASGRSSKAWRASAPLSPSQARF